MLKDMGVKKVVVKSVGYPLNPLVTSGGKGMWVGKVVFLQWLKPISIGTLENQDIPDQGPVTPSAASNFATAQAAMTAGAAALQTAAAQALIPPR
jgi:hypothetical protein